MRARLSGLAFAAGVVVAAVLAAFLSTRYAARVDVSHAQRASLAPQSRDLLRTLTGPVDVVSYASTTGNLREVIGDFVARYRVENPAVTLRFVDPESDPAAMRARGVRVDGEIEISYNGRSERLTQLNEREFSNALLRLARSRTHVVAFLAGAGERKPDGAANADLGQFGQLLAEQGVRTVPLVLGTGAKVPDNTDLVVVANPRVVLDPGVVAALVEWIDVGGALLWLTEPGENAGLDALANALSIRVLPGTVVDGAGAALGIGDPSFVAIGTYPPHAITRGFALTTLLPQAAAIAQLGAARWDLKSILRSGAQSWSESGAIPKSGEPTTIRFDDGTDEIRGPLDVGFALSRLSPRPDRREQRAAVIGDGDFLSNSFLGNGGNREFGQRLVNWLLADDALIDVPDRGAPDRDIAISQNGLAVLGL
ncbi:MAG TPA: DUF4350 domain-containing protein, partial [Tahibacter sp.]|nr:DUF4350 domain-containing protein [Tahibacter sp.]